MNIDKMLETNNGEIDAKSFNIWFDSYLRHEFGVNRNRYKKYADRINESEILIMQVACGDVEPTLAILNEMGLTMDFEESYTKKEVVVKEVRKFYIKS